MINTQKIHIIGIYTLWISLYLIGSSIILPVLAFWNGFFVKDYLAIIMWLSLTFLAITPFLMRDSQTKSQLKLFSLFWMITVCLTSHLETNHPLGVYITQHIEKDNIKKQTGIKYRNNVYMLLLSDQLREELISFYNDQVSVNSQDKINALNKKIKESEKMTKKYKQEKKELINIQK